MIFWLTGNTGAGKSTLAKKLAMGTAIVLDGNEMRDVWPGLTLSKEDRWENCLRVARLAKLLESQGFSIIVAVIAPFEDLRKEIYDLCKCRWVYLTGGKIGPEYPYEPPSNPDWTVTR